MRQLLVIAISFLLMDCAGTIAFRETVDIKNDRGGLIYNFIAKYKRWAARGEHITIDGYCASSCTVFMGIIPRDHVCLTRKAILGFHGAWSPSITGKQEFPQETHLMTDLYTPEVRAWIAANGGLLTYKKMLLMKWPETAMYFTICGQ